MFARTPLGQLHASSIRQGFMKYGKPLFSPSGWPLLFSLILTLVIVIYFTSFIFTRYPLKVRGIYHLDYFEVVDYDKNYLPDNSYLQAGDQIKAIDRIPFRQLITADYDYSNKILLYQSSHNHDNIFSVPEKQFSGPLQDGQLILIWSVSAQSLTVNKASSSDMTCNCSEEIKLAELASLTPLVSLRLIASFRIVLAACLIISGFFVYSLRPREVVTIVLSQFFYALAVQQLSSSVQAFQFGFIEQLLAAISFLLIPAFFLHFVMLFPGTQLPASRLSRLTIINCYGLTLGLILIRLALFTINLTDSVFSSLLRNTVYLYFVVAVTLSIAILAVKLFKSQGQDRLRLKLAVYSLIFTASIPLLVFVAYLCFATLKPFLSVYFGLSFFPALLLPPLFTYAVVKNRLLGITVAFRRFVMHIFLYLLVMTIYLLVSVLVGIAFPALEVGQSIGLTNALLTPPLLLLINQLKQFSLKLVDWLFDVDPINYGVVSNEWANRLAKIKKLSELCKLIILKVPATYHYRDAQLILFHPALLRLWKNETVTPLSKHRETDSSAVLVFSNGSPHLPGTDLKYQFLSGSDETGNENNNFSSQEIEKVPDKLAYTYLKLDSNYWQSLQTQSFVLLGEATEDQSIRKVFNQPELKWLDTTVVLPLRLQENYFGALLLDRKKSEYLPTKEELNYLGNLADQIAVALSNALSLDQAVQLARTEKKLRRALEQMIEHEQATREDERNMLFMVLHTVILPMIVTIRGKLEDLLYSSSTEIEREGSNSEISTYNLIDSALEELSNKIRLIIVDFKLSLVDHFVLEVRHLFSEYQRQHPAIFFDFHFEGNENLLDELILDQAAKTSFYRLLQEAVDNAIKHARAKHICACIRVEAIEQGYNIADNYLIEIRVTDDGIGLNLGHSLDLNQLVAAKHFGLNNMHRQIQKYGGELMITTPSTGHGTEITIQVTLQPFLVKENSPVDLLLQVYGID
jgi:signal transduction histidine kinase